MGGFPQKKKKLWGCKKNK